MADQERLTPEEVGRKAAEETSGMMNRMLEERDQTLLWLNNREAAQRHVQATGGTGHEVLRMVFEAGNTPIEPPRPRLVTSEG